MPHNLIFHGVAPDWIETHELMVDDPDFIKDVDPIGQRIRSLIREEVSPNTVIFAHIILIIGLTMLTLLKV